MAFRVDREGYRLDLDGNRIDTSPEDRAKFQGEIQRAWAAAHTGEIPADQTIMIVEDGDCQWTIAEDAGADPANTAYTMNGQFGDPDLIFKDQAVFLGNVNQYRTGADGNNTDIFSDNVSTRAANGGDNTLVLDTTRYMASVPEGERLGVLQHSVADAGSSAARKAIIEGYLLSFDPLERPAKAAELKAYYANSPDPSSDTRWAEFHADVNSVLTEMGLNA